MSDSSGIWSPIRRGIAFRSGTVGGSSVAGGGIVDESFVSRSVIDRSVVNRRVRRGGDVSSIVDRLLQSPKFGGRERTTLSGTIQILDRDRGGANPRGFVLFRIACRESNLYRRIVDRKSSLDILDQSLETTRKN